MKESIVQLLGFTSIVVALGLTSCKNVENPNVEIKITSPSNGATFNHGDTVKITGIITSDTQLHGYNVIIKNLSAGTIVEDEEEMNHHDHGANLTINHQWVNNVMDHSDMRAIIKVVLDHNGNETVIADSVNFHCHPY